MSEREVTIQLPVSLCERLEKVAEASGWSFEEVVVQTIRSGMPPSLIKVPEKFHPGLLALNKMDDQELWDAGQGEWLEADTSHEAEKAGLATLRRAYAFALLKWRGHPVPDPSEFLL
jgi:hypothetical protein